LRSHQRAIAAIEAGWFRDEITPLTFSVTAPVEGSEKHDTRNVTFTQDEGPRRDTSAEALAKLRPAFHAAGSVTAGNSSQMSDGAAAVLVTSAELARERGLRPLARFVTYATAGVEPERFGIGPVPAMRKALKLAGLSLDDIGLVELNEAFAAQVLACLREMPIDPDRLNVNGGAIALGHPLGCTGAKLTASILHEMHRRQVRYGMVTMCVGGGMGAAGIFERI
jgi:acetyl-CoA acyltransferase